MKRPLHVKSGFVLFALTASLCLAKPATAQNARPPAPQDNRPAEGDINREELARFDQFLDNHRQIGEELRRDPSLVDNREYVDNHPDLRDYFRDHPTIREEIKSHPDAFMRAEERFDRREDDRDRGANRDDRGINSEEIASFDQLGRSQV
jgi:hypothetical protein